MQELIKPTITMKAREFSRFANTQSSRTKTVRRFGWICSNSLHAAGFMSLAAGAVTVTAAPTFG